MNHTDSKMEWPPNIGLLVERNPHRLEHSQLRAYLYDCQITEEDIPPGELEKMLATDELWVVRWYPDTPVGFHQVAASTLEAARNFACGYGHPSG